MDHSRYFLLLKDDFSHFYFVYFLAAKSDVVDCIGPFLKKIEKHCPKGVKTFRSDNGLEFVNSEMTNLLENYGIQHQRTVAYCPEQNGKAERQNRTVVEAARTLIHARGLHRNLWAEAVNTVVYVLNRTGESSEKQVTPFELWNNSKPDIGNLHIFDEKVYVHIPKIKRKKFDKKAEEGIFVGYDENVKGYRIFFQKTNQIKVMRDVIVAEKEIKITENIKSNDAAVYLPVRDNGRENHERACEEYLPEEVDDIREPDEPANEDDGERSEEHLPQEESEEEEEDGQEDRRQLRKRRAIKLPQRYNHFINIEELFTAEGDEILTFKDAISSPDAQKWQSAMKEEIDSLHKNMVWTLVDFPEK